MNDSIDRAFEELKGNPALPRHVAIIMDGNGRWARKRHLPRLAGHRAGTESVRAAIRASAKLGLSTLSLYTFSLENWRRPRVEVEGLMRFLREVLHSEYLELRENNIRLRAIGRLGMLPRETRQALDETIDKLSGNTGMVLNLCLSYGGRAEIVDAARSLAGAVRDGNLPLEDVDDKTFRRYLYDPELSDPDLLVRTSGEMRISNFFLWQLAYTEIVVTDTLWPDFREEHLIGAIREYLSRERRFGGLKEGSDDDIG
ncbi:MAG: isoprenyl transferase [Candidatus Krumholzibacteria bacterium]|nr:isoprenyl transferase [Candidatus Krumholzibacteria bacterium]